LPCAILSSINNLARDVRGPIRPVGCANVGFAKLHNRKAPRTAADPRSDRTITSSKTQDIAFQSLLTDRGTECGAGAILSTICCSTNARAMIAG
jgi:hypothetical protein